MAAVLGVFSKERVARSLVSYTLAVLVVISSCYAAYAEVSMAARVNPMAVDHESSVQILRLYDEMAMRSESAGWASPKIMMDRLQDYMVASHLGMLVI